MKTTANLFLLLWNKKIQKIYFTKFHLFIKKVALLQNEWNYFIYCVFIKYYLQEKFIFRQLVMNFAKFLQNNIVFMEKKKFLYLKIYQPRKKFIFQQLIANFADFWRNYKIFMQENCSFKKYQPWRKIYVLTISSKFCRFSVKWCIYAKINI